MPVDYLRGIDRRVRAVGLTNLKSEERRDDDEAENLECATHEEGCLTGSTSRHAVETPAIIRTSAEVRLLRVHGTVPATGSDRRGRALR